MTVEGLLLNRKLKSGSEYALQIHRTSPLLNGDLRRRRELQGGGIVLIEHRAL